MAVPASSGSGSGHLLGTIGSWRPGSIDAFAVPGYLGQPLVFAGFGLVLANWMSFAAMVLFTLVAFRWRMAVEEAPCRCASRISSRPIDDAPGRLILWLHWRGRRSASRHRDSSTPHANRDPVELLLGYWASSMDGIMVNVESATARRSTAAPPRSVSSGIPEPLEAVEDQIQPELEIDLAAARGGRHHLGHRERGSGIRPRADLA